VRLQSATARASALLLLALIIGCADPVRPTRTTTTTSTPTSTTTTTTTTTGTITTSNLVEPGSDGASYGGRQPISGAHIHLYAANTQDWGYPSIPLLNAGAAGVKSDADGTYVTTDSSGNFTFTGLYKCIPGQQVYVYGSGGNPGIAPGQINSAIGMLAIFGTCPSDGTFAGHISAFVMNEVTTAAAVYSLAGFMTDATHVAAGPSLNAQAGLANAFATIQNLVDIGKGTALPGNGDNGFSLQSKLNTLADMLAPCINSSGLGVGCSNLFSNTKVGTITPTNTVAAMLNIAKNPAQNTAALFSLAPANSPYQPMLSAAPNDWTLAITFFSDNMPGPYYPAFDSKGNLWVPGYAYDGLTKFSPLGVVIQNYTGGGLNQPFAVAIDASDNPWIVNFAPVGAATVSVFKNNGTPITTTPYACAAACFFPAFDTSGNLWVSGSSSATVLSPSGSQTSSYWTSSFASGLAVDSANRAWTLGQYGSIYRLAPGANRPQIAQPLTGQTGNELTPLAIDSADNIWFASSKTSVLGKVDPNGALISPDKGFTGGGLSAPAGIAIDGDNRIWVANRDGNSLSAFTSTGVALSPANGYRADNVSGPRGIAIDASGNVWIANFTYNSVTEFVGAATPVATPNTPRNHGQRP
jgi:streptogramin lyase